MADGVIGSVKVRVRPDTTLFAKELKKGVDGDIRKVNNDLKNGPKIKVHAELDATSLKRSATEAIRKLNAELKDGPKVKFAAEISEIGMKSAIKKAARELNALAKAETVKFKVDAEAGKVEIAADLDQASLARVNAMLDAYVKRISPKRVTIMADYSAISGKIVDKQLDVLARPRKAEIRPEMNEGALGKITQAFATFSGVRLVGGIFKDFQSLFSNIDKMIPLVGTLTLAASGLSGALLAGASNGFALSRALAQIGPGALALPGLFGGIAIGLGATVAVFKDFNQQLPWVTGELSKIQDSMSEKFWDRARKPIADLIHNLLPQFATGLDKTAGALGTFFANLAGSLNGKLDGAIAGMFRDLNASIREMATHTDSIATIVKILGQLGAGRLPELAKWLGEITDKLAGWLKENNKGGKNSQLNQWIDTAIVRIKTLGTVLKNGALLFSGLAKAADASAPGDALTVLADSLGRAQAVVNSSGFQKQLIGVLTAAHTMMDEISTRSGPAFKSYWDSFATTLQTILPRAGEAIGTLADAILRMMGSASVQNGIVALVDGVAKGVENLAPAFDVLGPKLGALLTLLGQMADTFGLVFSAALEAVAPQMTALLGALTPLVKQVGPIVAGVFKDLEPVFEVFGENITKVGAAISPLLDAFQNLWNVIGPLLIPVLKIVVSILGEALVQTINGLVLVFNGLAQIIEGVVNVFKGLWDIIAGVFTGDFSRIGDGFGKIFSGLKDIAVGALKVVAGAIWAYINGSIFSIFRTAGVKLLGPFLKGFAKFLPGITKVMEGIGKALSAGWKVIETIAEASMKVIGKVIEVAWVIIKTYFEVAFKVISTIVKTYWTVISTIFKAAWTIIKTIVTAGWRGISEFIGTSLDGLYYVFKAPWDAIAEFLIGLMNTIRAGIGLAWTAIRDGVSTEVNQIRAQIEMVWNAIKAVTSAVWGAIKAGVLAYFNAIKLAVTTYFNVYKTVIRTTWNTIKSVTSTLWNAIVNFIKGRWALLKADVQIVFAFIKNKVSTIWDAIKSKTSTIWNSIKQVLSTTWNTIKSTVSTAINDVKSTLSTSWNTIKSTITSTWNDIKSIVSGAWDSLKKTISSGVDTAVKKVKELPTRAKAALTGLGSMLIHSGEALIQGFIQGVENKATALYNKVKGLVGKVRKLFPFSPAKEGPFSGKGYTTYSGQALMRDFARGMTQQGPAVLRAALGIMSSLHDGLTKGTAGVRSTLNGLMGALGKDATDALKKGVNSGRTDLLKMLQGYDELTNKIKAKIKEIKDAAEQFKQQVVDSVNALGDPTQIDAGADADGNPIAVTYDKIVENLKAAVEKAKKFAEVIKKLKGLNLNETTMMQLLTAGPDSLDVARQIAQSGQAGVDALDKQQKKLDKYAEQAGDAAKQIYIENGMAAAKGFIQGFEDKQSDLLKKMRDVAREMVKAIKAELKIKSPSRVFRELGGYTGEGFVLGVKDTQQDAEKAIRGLSQARPRGIDANSAITAGAGSSVSKTVNYYAASGTPSLSGEESLFSALTRARSSGF